MSEISQVVKIYMVMIIWIILATTLLMNTIISIIKKDKEDMLLQVLVAFLGGAAMIYIKYKMGIPVWENPIIWAYILYVPLHLAGCGYFAERYHV